MRTRDFRQVDVFGTGPYTGNPVAVVLGADDLTTEQMARISAWTNLSECTFVLEPTTPDADYRVRIFRITTELPFAGHPTLGTARAWLDAGGVPKSDGLVVQECGVGLVPVRVDGEHLAFSTPPVVRMGDLTASQLESTCRVLRIDPRDVLASTLVDNGSPWKVLLLNDADAVMHVQADGSPQSDQVDVGVVGLYGDGAASTGAIEVRVFFNEVGDPVREDPITGSFNAAIAVWLTESGRLSAPYVARQGRAIGSDGRVVVTELDGKLWVGGATYIAVTGTILA